MSSRSRYKLEFEKLATSDERYERGVCHGWWSVRDTVTDSIVDSSQAPAGRADALTLLRSLRRAEGSR